MSERRRPARGRKVRVDERSAEEWLRRFALAIEPRSGMQGVESAAAKILRNLIVRLMRLERTAAARPNADNALDRLAGRVGELEARIGGESAVDLAHKAANAAKTAKRQSARNAILLRRALTAIADFIDEQESFGASEAAARFRSLAASITGDLK